MAGLEIRCFRNEDNSLSLVMTLPARRNGEVNFGALARINRELLSVAPEAFDPVEAPTHHATEAPMPPAIEEMIERAESDDPQVGSLKAGEAE